MKPISVVLAVVVLLSTARAQEEPEFLRTKALSFNFNGFHLSGVNGGIGGKLWLSDQNALTLAVDGNVLSRFSQARDTFEVDDEFSRSGISLAVGVERHADLGRGFSPYLIGGVSLSFDREERKYGLVASPYEAESRFTTVGVRTGVGLEYWVTRRFSLAGQQLFIGTYGSGRSRSGPVDSPMRNSRAFDFDLGASSLILSLYL